MAGLHVRLEVLADRGHGTRDKDKEMKQIEAEPRDGTHNFAHLMPSIFL